MDKKEEQYYLMVGWYGYDRQIKYGTKGLVNYTLENSTDCKWKVYLVGSEVPVQDIPQPVTFKKGIA